MLHCDICCLVFKRDTSWPTVSFFGLLPSVNLCSTDRRDQELQHVNKQSDPTQYPFLMAIRSVKLDTKGGCATAAGPQARAYTSYDGIHRDVDRAFLGRITENHPRTSVKRRYRRPNPIMTKKRIQRGPFRLYAEFTPITGTAVEISKSIPQ